MELTEREFKASARKKAAKAGAAMKGGRYPIYNRKDLKNAQRAIGRTPPSGRAAVRAHIRKRAKALGISMSESINKLNETLEQMLNALSEGKNWQADVNPHTPKSGVFGAVKPPMDAATKGPVYAPDKPLDKNIEMLTTSLPGPDDTQPIKADETQPIKASKPNITRIVPGATPSGPFTFKEKVPSPAEQAALKSKTK
jgi:hypothetical protein